MKAYEVLGGCCVCCGETEFYFLEIDHVRNNGYRGRLSSLALITLIISGEFDRTEYQLLCRNCNFAKRRAMVCPHERKRLNLGG